MCIRKPVSHLLPVGLLVLTALSACRDSDVATPTSPTLQPLAIITPSATVNSLLDDGDGTCTETRCTLRDAIITLSTGGIVDLTGLTGTIALDPVRGLLPIGQNLTLTGPGAANLSVSGGDQIRVFQILNGATVTISGLTITDGYHAVIGGAILNDGTLILDQVAVTSSSGLSTSAYGGAIYSAGTMTITQSTIAGNTARYGGGIATTGSLTISGSTVSGNTATTGGGGIFSAVTLSTDATTIVNSTISDNSSEGGGGALNFQGLTRIVLSTVTGNHASQSAYGGGVWSLGNTSARTDVRGSLIWGNTSGSLDTPDDVAAGGTTQRYNSLGYNLVGFAGNNVDFALEFDLPSDQTGAVDPMLGPLSLNTPGATATHALMAGSPAINTGTCTDHLGSTVTTDQRGVTRPQGSGCDIGAFERVLTFESECVYQINAKNGQRMINITWRYADPGVTVIRVTGDGRTTQKQLPPTSTGSWSGKVRTGVPTFEMWGGSSRGAETTNLVPAGTACVMPS